MAWYGEYVGLPFEIDGRTREGIDCYGLVLMVYKDQLGIDLVDCQGLATTHDKENLKEIAGFVEAEKQNWREVTEPNEFDVVLMRYGPLTTHVGIYVGGAKMLHVYSGINATLERLDTHRWASRIVGYYRHE